MFLLLVYLIGALSISFLCSVLEAVLLSTPMSYATMLCEKGIKSAKRLQDYKNKPDKAIAAILSLNTVAHTIGAAGVGAESARLFGNEYLGVASAVMTLLILVLSELIPKTIGSYYWRNLAILSVKIIRVLIIITYPLVLVSELVTKAFSSKKKPVSVSREEVSAMVSVGTNEGVFEAKESKIIQSCMRLVSVKARDIMTPNIVVESAPESLRLKDFDDKEFTFSRIPVYKEDKDYINGYVLRSDVLERIADDKDDDVLGSLIRPVLSFDEEASVSDIWGQMIDNKEHISIITDEYGCLRGIVTMEDVIETMLGVEIVDENDDVVDMQKLALERWKKMKAQRKTL
ncbi:MAG: CNNM domain-containing protein [Marinilabiliaceae bacterium]|nr:CNNM domain-containing protein [Bacteroidales bacterium]MDD5815930.1 CNNM domain-containing protein [Bacteroidales bacterium]MDY4520581.1 CNNM domain-containing protein [Bacteroidales bacterium]